MDPDQSARWSHERYERARMMEAHEFGALWVMRNGAMVLVCITMRVG